MLRATYSLEKTHKPGASRRVCAVQKIEKHGLIAELGIIMEKL
jgi:hypothetical protein